MAKIIKFALELKDGESARTIEDLRAHFDLEKVVAYFMNGRLLMWLRHRRLDTEADAVERLSTEDAELAKKLCEILGVAYENHQSTADAINATALMADHERLSRLRQITSDPELLAKIDRVAFDEKDLRRLAFDNEPEVYLCNGRFVIPLNVQNKHYIGIGKAEAVIVSEEWIDFAERHIQFTNVTFDEEYQKIAEIGKTELWKEKARDAHLAGNDNEARNWLKRAVDANITDAIFMFGYMYQSGGFGVTQDYNQAMKWYKRAADAGDGNAMNAIGYMYYNGEGVAQDDDEAVKWYQKAADAGCSNGMLNLGYAYCDGNGAPQDDERAIKWFKKAADAGNEEAMNVIGDIYYNGEGILKDTGKAVEWYEKAAEAGNDTSMVSLGNMYRDGKGVSQNYGKAIEWYRKAADAGNGDAMNQIGLLYWKGNVVEKNDCVSFGKQYIVANDWFRKAAEAGSSSGMYNLGDSYYNGKGIEQDYQKARFWIQKAADLGHKNAKKWLQAY